MKKGYVGISLCNWQSWVFLGLIVAIIFWVYVFASYCYATAPNSGDAPPICKALIDFVGQKEIVQYLYLEIFGAAMTALLLLLFATNQINKLINHRSIDETIDEILWLIPASTDDMIIELCERLKIKVNASTISIATEVMMEASPEALAKSVGWLLYLNYQEIEDLARRDQYNTFHALADQLLHDWPHAYIVRFAQALTDEKQYLGQALDSALKRRDLEHRIVELEKLIDECRAQESRISRDDCIASGLDSRFSHYHDLVAGKSAIAKWFKRRLTRHKKY